MNKSALLSLMKSRRSIRSFTSEPVSQELIEFLVDAARWAPSAGNTQPLEIIVVRSPSIKQSLANAAYNQKSIITASVLCVMCGDYSRVQERYGNRGKELYVIQDIAAATQNLLLMATALGLGSVWVGAFNEDAVKEILNIPEHVRPLAIIPIGYPLRHPSPPPRKDINSIIHQETF